jgi:hypothetical protein
MRQVQQRVQRVQQRVSGQQDGRQLVGLCGMTASRWRGCLHAPSCALTRRALAQPGVVVAVAYAAAVLGALLAAPGHGLEGVPGRMLVLAAPAAQRGAAQRADAHPLQAHAGVVGSFGGDAASPLQLRQQQAGLLESQLRVVQELVVAVVLRDDRTSGALRSVVPTSRSAGAVKLRSDGRWTRLPSADPPATRQWTG